MKSFCIPLCDIKKKKQNIIPKEFAENTGNKKEISNFVCYHLKTKKYGN